MTPTEGGSGHPRGADPIDRLVASTRRRLALFTLALVTGLLLAVGLTTALVATRLMHETIQSALEDAIATAARDTSEPSERRVSTGADTFVLLLDGTGDPLSGTGTIPLAGLPDKDAVGTVARSGSRDVRDVTAGGEHVRLLTVPVSIAATDEQPAVEGFAQAVYRLTLHERQENLLLWTIGIASALGILGAGVVTLLVTRRALGPIRAAFATERRFVAAASHELRTPVAIVRASAEIMEREDLVNDEGRPMVADIIAEADRMGLLVTDLLTLASAEAGALHVDRHPLELVAWLSGVANRAETMVTSAGLNLVTNLPAGRQVVVDADDDRLSQVLLILVDNAIEHSPSGGTITISLTVSGGRATIAVLDQGPGVPLPDRERIFEPFARLPGRRRTRSGSGLGLAIARQLTSRHGADLAVDDAPGGGARFTVRMPLALAGVTASPRPGTSRA